ncbi:MAG: metal ABC transporter permease [Xanthobacteraceae bacterium]|nr:metal ABC transporter permease [Xanthobacteraceae bacterium]
MIDRSPQGAEHVKKMLVGNILTIGADDFARLVILYAMIGAIHFVFRSPLLSSASSEPKSGNVMLWDLLFYVSFSIVVTSSVGLVGVLLVFSFLIIPAVIGSMYSNRTSAALCIGWAAGVVACFSGFGASLALDLPTGAVLVACFALVLALSAIARWLVPTLSDRERFKAAALWFAGVLCAAVLAQGAWILIAPQADQPLVSILEAANVVGPGQFLDERERNIMRTAAASEASLREKVEQLYEAERNARWQGEPLTEEAVQQLSNFQRSYNEMSRGERFVQERLRKQGWERGRWYVGIPAVILPAIGVVVIANILRRRRLAR